MSKFVDIPLKDGRTMRVHAIGPITPDARQKAALLAIKKGFDVAPHRILTLEPYDEENPPAGEG